MAADELEDGGEKPVDVATAAAEHEGERREAGEPWPALSPLELAVCLATTDGRPLRSEARTT